MKTILVAVDASPQRGDVLAQTARLAAQFESAVHVVSVVRPEDGWAAELETDRPQGAEAVLHTACSELAGYGVACSTHAAVGPVAREIARLAEDIHADLIVIGHRDLSWLDRLVEDSVGKTLLSLAPCSVLVVVGRR